MNLLAFHGKKEIKAKYVERLKAHHKADRIIQGQGWTGSRGCAVGCTLENYSHKSYETELGIPERMGSKRFTSLLSGTILIILKMSVGASQEQNQRRVI